jgi:hypothetical protein
MIKFKNKRTGVIVNYQYKKDLVKNITYNLNKTYYRSNTVNFIVILTGLNGMEANEILNFCTLNNSFDKMLVNLTASTIANNLIENYSYKDNLYKNLELIIANCHRKDLKIEGLILPLGYEREVFLTCSEHISKAEFLNEKLNTKIVVSNQITEPMAIIKI